jgi:hypothetical protein
MPYDYLLVCLVAFLVALLTLFSGFGLGTLLLPAFAVFFPIEVAVAATAAVHLANNLFKAALLGRHARWRVVVAFGLPAIVASVAGAFLLERLAHLPPLAEYHAWGARHTVTAVKLTVALLMAGFAVLELTPRFERLTFDPRFVWLGGLLSGFFGGLSGHQGALRTAFLVRLGLAKEEFIATGVVCAVLVDLARLPVYFKDIVALPTDLAGLLAAGALAAFAGSFLGTRLVKKVTMRTIQWVVGVMLLVMALALGSGLLPEKSRGETDAAHTTPGPGADPGGAH